VGRVSIGFDILLEALNKGGNLFQEVFHLFASPGLPPKKKEKKFFHLHPNPPVKEGGKLKKKNSVSWMGDRLI
jgi:hypothetical protein